MLDAAHMMDGGVDMPHELLVAPTSPAGIFPLPGFSFGRAWAPAAPPVASGEDASSRERVGLVTLRDPHAANRPPTREEWLRSLVQQLFLAVFFAMFGRSLSLDLEKNVGSECPGLTD